MTGQEREAKIFGTRRYPEGATSSVEGPGVVCFAVSGRASCCLEGDGSVVMDLAQYPPKIGPGWETSATRSSQQAERLAKAVSDSTVGQNPGTPLPGCYRRQAVAAVVRDGGKSDANPVKRSALLEFVQGFCRFALLRSGSRLVQWRARSQR